MRAVCRVLVIDLFVLPFVCTSYLAWHHFTSCSSKWLPSSPFFLVSSSVCQHEEEEGSKAVVCLMCDDMTQCDFFVVTSISLLTLAPLKKWIIINFLGVWVSGVGCFAFGLFSSRENTMHRDRTRLFFWFIGVINTWYRKEREDTKRLDALLCPQNRNRDRITTTDRVEERGTRRGRGIKARKTKGRDRDGGGMGWKRWMTDDARTVVVSGRTHMYDVYPCPSIHPYHSDAQDSILSCTVQCPRTVKTNQATVKTNQATKTGSADVIFLLYYYYLFVPCCCMYVCVYADNNHIASFFHLPSLLLPPALSFVLLPLSSSRFFSSAVALFSLSLFFFSSLLPLPPSTLSALLLPILLLLFLSSSSHPLTSLLR